MNKLAGFLIGIFSTLALLLYLANEKEWPYNEEVVFTSPDPVPAPPPQTKIPFKVNVSLEEDPVRYASKLAALEEARLLEITANQRK